MMTEEMVRSMTDITQPFSQFKYAQFISEFPSKIKQLDIKKNWSMNITIILHYLLFNKNWIKNLLPNYIFCFKFMQSLDGWAIFQECLIIDFYKSKHTVSFVIVNIMLEELFWNAKMSPKYNIRSIGRKLREVCQK